MLMQTIRINNRNIIESYLFGAEVFSGFGETDPDHGWFWRR
jgi:hypothetical protein